MVPTLITTLNQTNITFIQASAYHALALDINGNVYQWGPNWGAQIGFEDFVARIIPTKIPNVQNITFVHFDGYKTFAIDTNQDVYTWGSNSAGALPNLETSPSIIESKYFEQYNISYVDVGIKGGVFLSNDTAYSYGPSSNSGQNTTLRTYDPKRMNFKDRIKQISFSFSHGLAITFNGSVFGWGGNFVSF